MEALSLACSQTTRFSHGLTCGAFYIYFSAPHTTFPASVVIWLRHVADKSNHAQGAQAGFLWPLLLARPHLFHHLPRSLRQPALEHLQTIQFRALALPIPIAAAHRIHAVIDLRQLALRAVQRLAHSQFPTLLSNQLPYIIDTPQLLQALHVGIDPAGLFQPLVEERAVTVVGCRRAEIPIEPAEWLVLDKALARP